MSQFSTSFLSVDLNVGTELDTTHAPAKVRCSFQVLSAVFSLIGSGLWRFNRATFTFPKNGYLPAIATGLTRSRASSFSSRIRFCPYPLCRTPLP
jgi:hypothetical protein